MFSGPGRRVCVQGGRATTTTTWRCSSGPSHFVAFEGVALYPEGAFACPFGPIASRRRPRRPRSPRGRGLVRPLPSAHAREHSLEMQLPFLGRLLAGLPIVPLLMGQQIARDDRAAGARARRWPRLAPGAARRQHRPVALLRRGDGARRSMATCATRVAAFSPERLMDVFERYPERPNVAAQSAAGSGRRSR